MAPAHVGRIVSGATRVRVSALLSSMISRTSRVPSRFGRATVSSRRLMPKGGPTEVVSQTNSVSALRVPCGGRGSGAEK